VSIEFTIINEIFRRRVRAGDDVLLGIGDDAALTRLPDDSDLVTATDALVAGTHFLTTAPARSVGHRCLAVNLSDLAAMAAEPLWASLALGLPDFDRAWLEDFADGFFALADRYAVRLIGGDTVRSGSLFAAVTVQGCVPRGAVVRRSAASAGDLIYVTGCPGDAAAGRRLATGNPQLPESRVNPMEPLYRQFYFPEPRLAAGKALRSIASAMIDLSDGLHADLGRLLEASGAGASLDVARLPLSIDIRAAFDLPAALELALCGGDDYELCFTVPPDKISLLDGFAERAGCPLTMIGEVCKESGLRWNQSGLNYTVPSSGFEHFE
jgi:thiamine-monophosphate kinase